MQIINMKINMKIKLFLLSVLFSAGLYAQDFQCPDSLFMPCMNSDSTEDAIKSRLERFNIEEDSLVIPVRWHVIHVGDIGYTTEEDILVGIKNMNDAYANRGRYEGGAYFSQQKSVDTKIRFKLHDIQYHEDSLTFLDINLDQLLKTAYHDETDKYLNVYSVVRICDGQSCGIGGYAYFSDSHGQYWDGIVIRSDLYTHYALPHEAGHYLNLHHTFYNGCNAPGDFVDDTPYDAEPGPPICRGSFSSCGVENDNWENFMDYGLDCKNMFTQGQKDRMRDALLNIRYSLLEEPLDLNVLTLDSKQVGDSIEIVIEIENEGIDSLFVQKATDSLDFYDIDTLYLSSGLNRASLVDLNPDSVNYYRLRYLDGLGTLYSNIIVQYYSPVIQEEETGLKKKYVLYLSLIIILVGLISAFIGIKKGDE